MISNQQIEEYHRDGNIILEDRIDREQPGEVRASCEATIEAVLTLGRAEPDENTRALKRHRFQNPHYLALARGVLMEGLAAPDLLEFAEHVFGGDPAMLRIAAFTMEEGYEYLLDWHRDSYAAWGMDSPAELRVWYATSKPNL